MARSDPPGFITVRMGASRSVTVGPGSLVIIQGAPPYGAVIRRISGPYAELTFTPEGRERRVPLGLVTCSAKQTTATVDLSSVPRIQPAPTNTPQRSRRVTDDV